MGYVALGQSSSTLSGGEAQRIKLASYLTKGSQKDNILFLFDEPTTGLHFHDISKLLQSFRQLIGKGHSIIVIEHNTHLIEYVDHIIDLGPSGGKEGGKLLATGTPKELAQNKKSSLYGHLFHQSLTQTK
jgi:excinuclease ABC subunit A